MPSYMVVVLPFKQAAPSGNADKERDHAIRHVIKNRHAPYRFQEAAVNGADRTSGKYTADAPELPEVQFL
jgi:hypothetical protein